MWTAEDRIPSSVVVKAYGRSRSMQRRGRLQVLAEEAATRTDRATQRVAFRNLRKLVALDGAELLIPLVAGAVGLGLLGSLGRVDPVAQGLVVHAELSADLMNRAARRGA